MNKSLTPLIIGMSLVILMTFVMVNSRSRVEPATTAAKEMPTASPRGRAKMTLSGYDRDRNDNNRGGPTKLSVIPDCRQYLERARFLLSTGQRDKAEDELRTILIFYPKDFTALSLLGGVLFATGRYEDAAAILRYRMSLAPNRAETHEDLGLILESQQKHEEAVQEFLKAASLSPGSPRTNLKLAGLYALMGEREKGARYFSAAYEALKERILPFSFDPVFDGLRDDPEFTRVLDSARKEMVTRRAAATKADTAAATDTGRRP